MEKNIIVDKTIYEHLQDVRDEISKTPLKKSGFNKHLNFNYFELADFVPTATRLFAQKGLCPLFSITYDPNGVEVAVLKIVKGAESITFTSPTSEPTNMQGIQALGAKITYMRRYMYMIALDLTENDVVDASLDENSRNAKVEEKKATPKQIEMIRSLYDEENVAKMLEYYGINELAEMSLKTASDVIARKKK